MTFTAAFLIVQIHAALGAKTAAITPANRFHRQGKQDLLGQDIGQKHPFAFEKGDLRVVELQSLLFFLGNRSERLIKKIKFPGDILMDRFQAACADHLQPGMKLSRNSDLSLDKFGRGADFERFGLAEVARAVIHSSRGIALPDADLADCQLFDV